MNSKIISATVLAAMLLAGCAATYPRSRPVAATPPPTQSEPPRVFSYPLRDQTAQQQDRDRFECFNWAVTQTGYDPSRQSPPRQTREVVVPAQPSGSATFAGAVTGALVGAAVSSPRNRGNGAVIGAIAGTALGAAADSAEQSAAQAAADARRNNNTVSRSQGQAADFRRAMSACLEGRGYAVQ
jgi:outer membrane lipoprotein SlyB